MEQPIFGPFDLQCVATLAGIAGSEKLEGRTRNEANEILKTLLVVLKKDVEKLSLAASGIQIT